MNSVLLVKQIFRPKAHIYLKWFYYLSCGVGILLELGGFLYLIEYLWLRELIFLKNSIILKVLGFLFTMIEFLVFEDKSVIIIGLEFFMLFPLFALQFSLENGTGKLSVQSLSILIIFLVIDILTKVARLYLARNKPWIEFNPLTYSAVAPSSSSSI